MTGWYLYRAFSPSGALLYIGSTRDPQQRVQAHRKYSCWCFASTWFEVDTYPDREAACTAEAVAIADEQPPRNVYLRGETITPEMRIELLERALEELDEPTYKYFFSLDRCSRPSDSWPYSDHLY